MLLFNQDNSRMLSVLVTFLITQLIPAYSYFINVEPKKEICFYDSAVSGTKMSLTFEVAEGGFLDIDVRVCVLDLIFIGMLS